MTIKDFTFIDNFTLGMSLNYWGKDIKIVISTPTLRLKSKWLIKKLISFHIKDIEYTLHKLSETEEIIEKTLFLKFLPKDDSRWEKFNNNDTESHILEVADMNKKVSSSSISKKHLIGMTIVTLEIKYEKKWDFGYATLIFKNNSDSETHICEMKIPLQT